jgi:hypothetical protein
MMKIAFLGDIALGDHPKCIGYGFGSAYGPEIPQSKSQRLIPSALEAQLVFGNLEFPLYNRKLDAAKHPTVNKMCCRGWPAYADFLRKAGLSMVSVANNHIYQHGDAAFSETLRALNDAGIRTCGTRQDFSGEQILTVDGVTVAFLGWSDRPRQYFENEPPYNEVNQDACCRAVSEMKGKVDVVCVSLHWGIEFIEMPGVEDRNFAHSLIDAGASVVIGHHPHVLREVEQYAGGVIAYSLGNNVCDMLWDDRTRETACLSVEFNTAGVSNWELYPGTIDEDYFPTYFSGSARLKFLDELEQRYKDIREESQSITYQQLAERALKRHQRLSAWNFVRNLGRFDKSVLSDVIRNAIQARLRRRCA